jgi:hypothetical protein
MPKKIAIRIYAVVDVPCDDNPSCILPLKLNILYKKYTIIKNVNTTNIFLIFEYLKNPFIYKYKYLL